MPRAGKAEKFFGIKCPLLQKIKNKYDRDLVFNMWFPIVPAAHFHMQMHTGILMHHLSGAAWHFGIFPHQDTARECQTLFTESVVLQLALI